MERGHRPRERRDPKGRGVWDFMYNHEAAGSDVWFKPGFSSSSAKTAATLNPVAVAKPGTKKKACVPRRLTGRREYLFSASAVLSGCLYRARVLSPLSFCAIALCVANVFWESARAHVYW